MSTPQDDRRDFLKSAGAFTTSLFTGNLKGANDRLRLASIGTGVMGTENLGVAAGQPGVEIAAVCSCTVESVRARLFRTRMQLRAALQGLR